MGLAAGDASALRSLAADIAREPGAERIADPPPVDEERAHNRERWQITYRSARRASQ